MPLLEVGDDDREVRSFAKKLLGRKIGCTLAVSAPMLGELHLVMARARKDNRIDWQQYDDAMKKLHDLLLREKIETFGFGSRARELRTHLNGLFDCEPNLDPTDAVVIACMASDPDAVALWTIDGKCAESVPIQSYLRSQGKRLRTLGG